MNELEEVLERHFRLYRGMADCLPYCVRSRRQRSQDDRVLLARVMKDLEFRIGAEIGTAKGESAQIWCSEIPGLHLTCIDPYIAYRVRRSQEKQDAFYEEAKRRLGPFDVRFIRASSREAADQLEDGSLDFINIDGNHEFNEVVRDLIEYVPKVREGGLILVHDYVPFYLGGVVHAVDGYTTCNMIDPWYLTHKDASPTAFWQQGAKRK